MPLLALYVFDRVGTRAAVALIAMLVLINLHHTQPKGYQNFEEEYFSPDLIAKTGFETTTRGEYQPRWVQAGLPYTGDGLVKPPAGMTVRGLSRTPTRHEYSVTASANAGVMDSTNYYPGWTVLIDGRETAVTPAPGFGMLSFGIPAGQHLVTVELRQTGVRRFALIVSILFFALLMLVLVGAYLATSLELWPLGNRRAVPQE
jgi:hypothetical protein